MTNEELQHDCVKRMGLRLGLIFHRLQAEFHQLLNRWRPFRSLYGSDPKRIEILNEADADFFGITGQVMWESTLLGIARLVDDHPKVISLARVSTLLQKNAHEVAPQESYEKVRRACKFATAWRNNYIAHRSERLIFDEANLKLPSASRAAVEQAFDAIGEYLSEIDVAFNGSPTAWAFYRRDFTNPLHLHYVLSDGLRAKESKKRRFREGTHTQDDIEQRTRLWERDVE